MNFQTAILYGLTALMVLSGLIPCWRSSLSTGMKYLWSLWIIALPGAGTLLYFGYNDQVPTRD